ncbi:hypothetical protein IT882_08430 [Microbacterium schleiferi]|uniref:Uncharacterized protein n=1 Tax=Microbacterium schleiferi TaxID=69362 RepID=A0A7S8RG00_9MICO|nr:DUF6069 family protein [Microbacterium schleiferi]QPE03421.1 hypothetical protein IT882_08430 [Microbacterium schleiferi]
MTAQPASARSDRATTSKPRTVLLLAGAIVLAVALNAAIALAATAMGAPAGYSPLSLPVQALFTVLGVVVGWVGWNLVRNRARNPRRTLQILIPVVLIASLIPDLLLLALGFIPGTNVQAVVALMLMHVVVVGCAVPAYVLASPVLQTR